MRIVVIGGTGHIGTYLVPELVQRGHEVIVLSRGERTPYQDSGAWQQVELQQVDRAAEDAAGTFGQRVRDLRADVVIDLICYTLESAVQLIDVRTPGEYSGGHVPGALNIPHMSIIARNTCAPSGNSPRRIRRNRSRFSSTGRSR